MDLSPKIQTTEWICINVHTMKIKRLSVLSSFAHSCKSSCYQSSYAWRKSEKAKHKNYTSYTLVLKRNMRHC